MIMPAETSLVEINLDLPFLESNSRTDRDYWKASTRKIFKGRVVEAIELFRTIESAELEYASVSTLWVQDQQNRIMSYIENLFFSYSEEEFEDGMDNDFTNSLTACVFEYGIKAIHSIGHIVDLNVMKPQLVCEALRWLGQIRHPDSYMPRLFLLERNLNNPSRWIRDGAALGLAALKDPHSIRYLCEAIGRECIQELRQDMQAVLNRITACDASLSSEDK